MQNALYMPQIAKEVAFFWRQAFINFSQINYKGNQDNSKNYNKAMNERFDGKHKLLDPFLYICAY